MIKNHVIIKLDNPAASQQQFVFFFFFFCFFFFFFFYSFNIYLGYHTHIQLNTPKQ